MVNSSPFSRGCSQAKETELGGSANRVEHHPNARFDEDSATPFRQKTESHSEAIALLQDAGFGPFGFPLRVP